MFNKSIVLIISFFLFFSACSYDDINSKTKSNSGFIRNSVVTSFGVTYSPPNYPIISLDDYRQGLLEAATLGTHLSYIYAWDGGDSEFEIAARLMDSAKTLNLITLLQFGPSSIGLPNPPTELNFNPKSFNNPDLRVQFLEDVTRLAELEPDYLNLCTELNLMFFFNWQEYEYFKSLYKEAYNLAKSISPSTQVGVSYHLDLFFADEEYALLYDLGPQDYIGFTSYPAFLVYENYVPSIAEFPVEYYSRIPSAIQQIIPENPNIPVLFTEFGWPSAGDSNSNDQVEFIRRMPELMKDVKPHIISWALLHDVDFFQTWKLNQQQMDILTEHNIDPNLLFSHLNSMGLLYQYGQPKPAWFDAINLDFSE